MSLYLSSFSTLNSQFSWPPHFFFAVRSFSFAPLLYAFIQLCNEKPEIKKEFDQLGQLSAKKADLEKELENTPESDTAKIAEIEGFITENGKNFSTTKNKLKRFNRCRFPR